MDKECNYIQDCNTLICVDGLCALCNDTPGEQTGCPDVGNMMCTANGNCVDIDADSLPISGGELAGIIIGSAIVFAICIGSYMYC